MTAPVVFLFVALVFVFAYRFFAKLLADTVFGLNTNIIAPPANSADQGPAAGPLILLGQHIGLIATAITLSTTAVAVIWGWVPAFLWIVIGTTVAGGTYGLGSLWLSARHPGQGLGTVVQSYVGGPMWSAVLFLSLILLTAFNASLVVIIASLLVDHAGIVLPFWAELLLAAWLGGMLYGRPDRTVWVAGPIALLLLVLLVWLLGKVPAGFSGAFNLDLFGNTLLSVDAGLAWMVLLLAFVVYAQRLPVAGFLRPYALLSTLQIALVVLGLLAGITYLDPPFTAPQFHATPDAPGVLPWLFLTVTGGAIGGITLLIASAFTGPALRNPREVRLVGYGGALAEGVIALSALFAVSNGLDAPTWNSLYGSWHKLLDPSYLVEVYVNGGAWFGSALGLSNDIATNFTALAVAAISFVSLEAGVRLQLAVLTETGRRFRAPSPDRDPKKIPWFLLLLLAVVILADANGGAPSSWLVFGSANAVLACFGLLLMVAALTRDHRPGRLVAALLLLILALTLWALIAALGYWWQRSAWVPLALDLLLLGFGGWISLETVRILRVPTGRS